MTQREKLDRLIEIEGFDDLMDALAEWSSDSVVPGICMNPDCDNVEDVEPDSRDGWCSECNTNTVKAGTILAGVI
jgi:hypothetical protein